MVDTGWDSNVLYTMVSQHKKMAGSQGHRRAWTENGLTKKDFLNPWFKKFFLRGFG
jgi:hypothetical protein